MNKQRLYILCGLPFSGKSTLAKELVRQFGWVRVDLDQINSERGLGGLGNDDISNNDWRITYQMSYDAVDKALKEGKTVINDTTLLENSEISSVLLPIKTEFLQK